MLFIRYKQVIFFFFKCSSWKIILLLCLSSVLLLQEFTLFCLIWVLFAQHILLMTQVLIW